MSKLTWRVDEDVLPLVRERLERALEGQDIHINERTLDDGMHELSFELVEADATRIEAVRLRLVETHDWLIARGVAFNFAPS